MARVAPQKSRSWSIFYRMNEVRPDGASPVTDVPLLGGQDGNDHNDNAGEEMAVIARSTSANFSSRPFFMPPISLAITKPKHPGVKKLA